MLNDKAVREAFPPRSDVCQRVEWDLTDLAGQQVQLEIVDGDDGPSYAWLGVTRIEPAVVKIESFSSDNEKQKQLRTLASILKTTAPVGLRDRLAPYLPKPAVAPAPPQPRPELDALIAARRTAFAKAKLDASKGEAVFKANCAVCHTIKGQGGVIGPQLDGVGNRGADRLMEDILDPNRNVDAHFHLHQLKLRDGSTVTGFIRGEVGQVTILVDAANTEQRIAKGDIAEDTDLPQSLMPPAFGQTIPEASFNDLIAWLLKN
jgi:putative heme-binding domain-containing protein